MRTFLCAICILLLMLGAILFMTHRILDQVETMLEALAALPDAAEADCASAVGALDEQWQRAKPIVGLAVNGHTVAEIDRLVTSLRVIAVSDGEDARLMEWERYRELLVMALEDLEKMLRCGVWELV